MGIWLMHCQGKTRCSLKLTSFHNPHQTYTHTHIRRELSTPFLLLSAVFLCFRSLTEMEGRQMIFLTLPTFHSLISFTFSDVPLRSSLVQSEERELCAVSTAVRGPVGTSTERFLQLILPSVAMQALSESRFLL